MNKIHKNKKIICEIRKISRFYISTSGHWVPEVTYRISPNYHFITKLFWNQTEIYHKNIEKLIKEFKKSSKKQEKFSNNIFNSIEKIIVALNKE